MITVLDRQQIGNSLIPYFLCLFWLRFTGLLASPFHCDLATINSRSKQVISIQLVGTSITCIAFVFYDQMKSGSCHASVDTMLHFFNTVNIKSIQNHNVLAHCLSELPIRTRLRLLALYGISSCTVIDCFLSFIISNKRGCDVQKTEEEKDGEPSIEAQVNTYLLESFANGVEGLMLKPLDVNATYQASKRSENWLKLKKWVVPKSSWLNLLKIPCYLAWFQAVTLWSSKNVVSLWNTQEMA